MKKTFIAIVAVIITSASIFLACSKDSENEEVKNSTSNIKEKCTEFQEQLGEDATIIGFASFDNPEEIFYTFNFDELVEKTSFLCQQEFGFDVILEDVNILDEDVFNSQLQPGLKISIFISETEDGATILVPVNKISREDIGTTIYYTTPSGGTNEPAYYCKRHGCKSCKLHLDRDNNGRITAAWCECKLPQEDTEHYCSLEIDHGSFWSNLCSAVSKLITINIGSTN